VRRRGLNGFERVLVEKGLLVGSGVDDLGDYEWHDGCLHVSSFLRCSECVIMMAERHENGVV
jgi:hypothetical protein